MIIIAVMAHHRDVTISIVTSLPTLHNIITMLTLVALTIIFSIIAILSLASLYRRYHHRHQHSLSTLTICCQSRMVLSVLYSCGIMAVVLRHSTAFCFEETSTQFLPVKQEIDDDDDDESIKGNKFCIIEVGQGETLPLHKKVKKLSKRRRMLVKVFKITSDV